MPGYERILVGVDRAPWAGLVRLTVGYWVVPLWSRLFNGRSSGWMLFPFFLTVLIALRLVPAVLRRLMPFGEAAQQIWAERRQLAKRFDSYQWQKLFWMGLGLAVYTLQSGRPFGALLTLTFMCLAFGAIGLVIWHRQRIEGHR